MNPENSQNKSLPTVPGRESIPAGFVMIARLKPTGGVFSLL